jgi:L-ascorbate metabolism protein UlaG (beta-lactamase superfamily)
MLYILITIVTLLIGIFLYINLHPTFGGSLSKDDRLVFSSFENFAKGKFFNQQPTVMDMNLSSILSLLKDSISSNKERKPSSPLSISSIDWSKINNGEDSLTWFGHSTFLLSIDGKKILGDPMFGPSPSPVSFAGGKRYSKDLLYIIDELPAIDAVFITHDHYDHLDYSSILKLRDKVSHFFVPYGVGGHLQRWGIIEEKISELNWWDELNWQGLTIASVPAQHFSGRGMFNRDTTLWTGWVILGETNRFYTSGDGGYGPHFKDIGVKYGPFDLTLIEGGQYDRRWAAIHMMPEQSVQAHLDVRGKNMMLIHWGAFTLAYHGWSEPVERAILEAKEKEVNLIAPRIGETVLFKDIDSLPVTKWWK